MLKGEYFADYIEELDLWGIFHTDYKTGHCFATYSDRKEAEQKAEERNNY